MKNFWTHIQIGIVCLIFASITYILKQYVVSSIVAILFVINLISCFFYSEEVPCISKKEIHHKEITEQMIREYAYYLWIKAKKPDNVAEMMWLEAEKQLKEQFNG